MFYDSLHVIVIMPNTAEDALNAFENRYCAEISEKLLYKVHVQKSLFSFL